MRYQIGSKLLGLNNTKDDDQIEIVDGSNIYVRSLDSGIDLVKRSIDHIQKFLNYEPDMISNAYLLLINYQLDAEIIGQNFPITFHIIQHKDKVEQLLETIKDKKLLNYSPDIYGQNKTCLRSVYHVAYTKFILKNNSPIITAEQKAIVQKIHDRQMTWDEFKEKVGY